MPNVALTVETCCKVDVTVQVPGARAPFTGTAVLDTGFFHSTLGVGLALPSQRSPRGKYRPKGILKLTLGHGKARAFRFDPAVALLAIGGVTLGTPRPVGAIFTKGSVILLGFNVLKTGVLTIDGPGASGAFTFD